MFVTSTLGLAAIILKIDVGSILLASEGLNGLLLVLVVLRKGKTKTTLKDSLKFSLNSDNLVLFSLVIFSWMMAFIMQFVYNPFVRGDAWGYVEQGAAISKNLTTITQSPNVYWNLNLPVALQLIIGMLVKLSGFPPVNLTMLLSFAEGLTPLAFYCMSSAFFKGNKRITLASTFVYTLFSGFGWIYFLYLKNQMALPFQNLDINSLITASSTSLYKTLADTSSPLGIVQEGIKTYSFGLICVMMMLYILEDRRINSDFTKSILIALLVFFGLFVHIEDIAVSIIVFLPLYIIIKNIKRIKETLTILLPVTFSSFLAFGVACLYQNFQNFQGTFFLVAIIPLALLLVSWLKRTKIFIEGRKLLKEKIGIKPLKHSVAAILCYYYGFSIIALLEYGFSHMTAGVAGLIMGSGYAFPWYYYPLRLGIAGLLALICISAYLWSTQRNFSFCISYFATVAVGLFLFGELISFINQNFFFTGLREIRIVGRLLPLPIALLAGCTLVYLAPRFTSRLRLRISLPKRQRLLKTIYVAAFAVIVICGSMSTILSADTWMVYTTPSSEEISAMNWLWMNAKTGQRAATLDDWSGQEVYLAGLAAATTANYPNIFSLKNIENDFLLSSDLYYTYLSKIDTELIQSQDYFENPLMNFIFNYTSTAFNNSEVTIDELPYFSPPVSSEVGYILPLSMSDENVLPLFSLALTNCSYDTLLPTDSNILQKQVLIIPYDVPLENEVNLNYSYGTTQGPQMLTVSGFSINTGTYPYLFIRWESLNASLNLYFGLENETGFSPIVLCLGTSDTVKDSIIYLPDQDLGNQTLTHLAFRTFETGSFSINEVGFLRKPLVLPEAELLGWIKGGGRVIVFGDGGSGLFLNIIGERQENFGWADSIIGPGGAISLPEKISVPCLTASNSTSLAYYEFNNQKIAPLALLKEFGNGSIVYMNANLFLSLIKGYGLGLIKQLDEVMQNFRLPSSSGPFGREPMESRWFNQYPVWGENGLNFTGQITIEPESIDTSTLLNISIGKIYAVFNNSTEIQMNNILISSLQIIGDVNTTIASTKGETVEWNPCDTYAGNYLNMYLYGYNLIINVSPKDSLILCMPLSGGGFRNLKFSGAQIVLSSDSTALFRLKRPHISVNGEIYFNSITINYPFYKDIPAIVEPVSMKGLIKIDIGSADQANTFFANNINLDGSYQINGSNNEKWSEFDIPWANIITSAPNMILMIVIILAFVSFSLRNYRIRIRSKTK